MQKRTVTSEDITVKLIWDFIINNQYCIPRSLKCVLITSFDEIMDDVIARNRSVEDIVKGMVLSESVFNVRRQLSCPDDDNYLVRF